MINNSYTALTKMLMDNEALTSQLGVFLSSSGNPTEIPLIKGGILEESQTQLPAVTFRVDTSNYIKTLKDQFFIVTVHAETEQESFNIAQTIINEFNECDSGVEGYQARTTCRIIGNSIDPTSKEVSTPIEFRIVNIFN